MDPYNAALAYEKAVTEQEMKEAEAWSYLESITDVRHRNLIMPFRKNDTTMCDPEAAWNAISKFYLGGDINVQRENITNDLRLLTVVSTGNLETDIGNLETPMLELSSALVQPLDNAALVLFVLLGCVITLQWIISRKLIETLHLKILFKL